MHKLQNNIKYCYMNNKNIDTSHVIKQYICIYILKYKKTKKINHMNMINDIKKIN